MICMLHGGAEQYKEEFIEKNIYSCIRQLKKASGI